MFRAGQGFRQKTVWFILKATTYSSLWLGLFPFTFDAHTRQLHRSKWLVVYGFILNFVFIGLSLQEDSENENYLKTEIFLRNPLVKYTEAIVGVISMVTACVTHLRNLWCSKELERIVNELLLLEERHFNSYTLEDCPKFDYYVTQKCLVIVMEVLSSLLLHFCLPGSQKSVLYAFFTYMTMLAVLLGAMHYHLAVVFIYRFVWTINGQLLDLANQLRMGRRVESSRVQLLLRLYSRLLDLNNRLTGIYDYQITLLMANVLAANIVISFVLIIFSIGLQTMPMVFLITVIPQALCINFWDFWLSIAVSDLAEQTGRRTSTILRLFSDMNNLDEDLERSINDFAWFCSHRKLQFFHCGLFQVNYEMGFRMIITSILYLLFLVQFDYMNL